MPCAKQKGAVLLIKKKGELTHDTEKDFAIPEVKMLLKWKKVKAVSTKKIQPLKRDRPILIQFKYDIALWIENIP